MNLDLASRHAAKIAKSVLVCFAFLAALRDESLRLCVRNPPQLARVSRSRNDKSPDLAHAMPPRSQRLFWLCFAFLAAWRDESPVSLRDSYT